MLRILMRRCLGLAALAGLMLLSACASFDWRGAGRNLMLNACETADNCTITCPDGTRTDRRFPVCDDVVNEPVSREEP